MEEQEGPTSETITITQIVHTCTGCKWMETRNATIHFGDKRFETPTHHYCRHPSAGKDGYFGFDPDTPTWCPFLQAEESE